MGRHTGPVCKQCRREGMKLFLKGARCLMAKCPIETGRPPPGMHGQRRSRKLSDYGMQLRGKQKLRRQYGMQEGQFRLLFNRAMRHQGVTGEVLLQLLEQRLDSVVYRMGFAASRNAARQLVCHNHVLVDGRKANIPSMILNPGSKVTVRDNPKSKALASFGLEATEGRELRVWVTVDPKSLSGEFVRIPTRDEIAPIVDEQLVVELYSK